MGAGRWLREERMGGAPARARRRGAGLYAWLALLAALIVFAGFARTFFLRSLSGAPALSPLFVVHGTVMSSWFVLFGLQVWLVGAGRTGLHRRLGLLGAVVAALVLVVGVEAAIDAARRGATPSTMVTALEFMAIPLFDMPVFALLVGVALWQRRRPDFPKRLMLLASLSLLTPAIARIPLGFIQDGGPPVFFGLWLLVLFACIAVDTARTRRLHPAYAWGAALLVTMLPIRLLVAVTDTWARFAAWLVG